MITIRGQQTINSYTYVPPGDKSISHRVAILGALSKGNIKISNFAQSKDCFSTLKCLEDIGVDINISGSTVSIKPGSLEEKGKLTLDCGNSGTTARLLPAVLGGLGIEAELIGDRSLSKRPMDRVIAPLMQLGGVLESTDGHLPITVKKGWEIKGQTLQLKVASAQIKTAVLLAGLFSDKPVTVIEPEITRDHTEIMLKEFGVQIVKEQKKTTILSQELKSPQEYIVAGDFSSAAYFIALGLLNSEGVIEIKDVGLNPTRTAFLDVVKKMGGKLEIIDFKTINGEQQGNVKVYPSKLVGIEVPPNLVPNLIDEIPLIAVLAAFAQGQTRVTKAKELRVKESDRISSILACLKKMGAETTEYDDGFEILGGKDLQGTEIHCNEDHRIVMSMAIASLFSQGSTTIVDSQWVNISNTDFFIELKKIAPSSF